MKTFLHYLNWALHDFNRASFYVIKHYLKYALIGASFIAVALGPVFIPGMTLDLLTIWAAFVIIISPFVFISVKIYYERKNPVIPEPEVVIDSYTDLPTELEPEEPLEPLTVKQSMKDGLSWTVYLYGILFGAVILTVIYHGVVSWFI